MILKKVNPFGEIREMNIPFLTPERLDEFYLSDKLIQDFFPKLSDNEREFILSGCSAEDWDRLWEDVDEEDYKEEYKNE